MTADNSKIEQILIICNDLKTQMALLLQRMLGLESAHNEQAKINREVRERIDNMDKQLSEHLKEHETTNRIGQGRLRLADLIIGFLVVGTSVVGWFVR